MKKFIVFLVMLFITTVIYAKQFCVKIDCYKDNDSWKGSRQIHVNVEDEINKYLNKGYKLIAIVPEITTSGYGSCTISYYCIFEYEE